MGEVTEGRHVGGGACAAWRGRHFGGKGSEWRLGCGRQRGEVNRSRPGVKEVSSILRQRFDLTRGGPKEVTSTAIMPAMT